MEVSLTKDALKNLVRLKSEQFAIRTCQDVSGRDFFEYEKSDSYSLPGKYPLNEKGGKIPLASFAKWLETSTADICLKASMSIDLTSILPELLIEEGDMLVPVVIGHIKSSIKSACFVANDGTVDSIDEYSTCPYTIDKSTFDDMSLDVDLDTFIDDVSSMILEVTLQNPNGFSASRNFWKSKTNDDIEVEPRWNPTTKKMVVQWRKAAGNASKKSMSNWETLTSKTFRVEVKLTK